MADAYVKEPPWRERFFADRALPPEPVVFVWPSIAWASCPPFGGGRVPNPDAIEEHRG